MSEVHDRPDPDLLLKGLQREEESQRKGHLKIFFGMCAGVGKTYEMLKAAHDARSHGEDVLVGIVETHGRPETTALLEGLEILPRKQLLYRGIAVEEMDIDAILARKPTLVLVDELAHTNAQGSRHTKRYRDVLELLDNGINVCTTLNVQHLESRADAVAQITGIPVLETLPDSILDRADDVELIDLPPDELLRRLEEGKVYTPDRSRHAAENFFRKGNITALREMSLRVTAERVDRQLRTYMRDHRISGPWKSGQRLIVGISGSPHSAHLIRWARRLTYSLGATWVAVHVETSRGLSEDQKKDLAKNIAMARELGAEIVTTADEDVGKAILRVARQENCTQILLGKSREGAFGRQGKLFRAVMEQSGDLDVHIVGGEKDGAKKKPRVVFPAFQSGLSQYLAAAGIVAAVELASFPLSELMGYQTVALILLLTVALLSLRLGIGPVVLAATLSALGWDFFFIPQIFTFSVARLEDGLMLAMYFGLASVTGILTSRARAQERAVRQREERAVALYSLSRDLSLARSKDEVVKAAVGGIDRFLQADTVVCLGQSDGDIFTAPHAGSTLAVDDKEMAVAAWVYWNEKKAGAFTDTLPSSAATYFPLSGPRYPLGVIGVKPRDGKPLTTDQEALMDSYIRQIASAIERETLNELTKKAIVVEESERLYKTLFNSISHEMRTPLAAILSASEGLLDDHVSAQTEMRKELSSAIHEAAERLNRLVENLLNMTRLESGLIQPKRDWCDALDLINSARDKLTRQLARHNVTVSVSSDMPLLKIDFTLMEQVITNLLVNAAYYTPAGSSIAIGVRATDREAIITIGDTGPGVPVSIGDRVFEKFYRAPGTEAGGTGLGLSIARGFVEAHHGTIAVGTWEGGGAEFTIRLPLETSRTEGTE